jgi:hypothetical protein
MPRKDHRERTARPRRASSADSLKRTIVLNGDGLSHRPAEAEAAIEQAWMRSSALTEDDKTNILSLRPGQDRRRAHGSSSP